MVDRINASGSDVIEWLRMKFPRAVRQPFAARHERFWDYIESIKLGERPKPRAEIWPRGGGKSSSGHLAVARLAFKRERRFVLYLSGTQDQANRHLMSVGNHLAKIGLQPGYTEYKSRKGWNRQILIAKDFTVVAQGLETAARGMLIEDYRPDYIVADDFDGPKDTRIITESKIEAFTGSIIPTGSTDCGILLLQNLIHEGSMMNMIYTGTSEFLMDIDVPEPEPAIFGMTYERVRADKGRSYYVITGGAASWEGQDIKMCEAQINAQGLKMFLRESQHEVDASTGKFFLVEKGMPEVVSKLPCHPNGRAMEMRVCLAEDLAATEGGGDHTVFVVMAWIDEKFYILDIIRGQWESHGVRQRFLALCSKVRDRYPDYVIRVTQDPNQAGTAQRQQLEVILANFNTSFKSVARVSKATRAEAYSEDFNVGNVKLYAPDPDEIPEWVPIFIDEHRRFSAYDRKADSDIIDCCVDAHEELRETPVIVHENVRVSQRFNRFKRGGSNANVSDDDADDGDFRTPVRAAPKVVDLSKFM